MKRMTMCHLINVKTCDLKKLWSDELDARVTSHRYKTMKDISVCHPIALASHKQTSAMSWPNCIFLVAKIMAIVLHWSLERVKQHIPLVPVMVHIPDYRIQMIPTFQLGPATKTCTMVFWMLHKVTEAEERFENVAKRFDIANVHLLYVVATQHILQDKCICCILSIEPSLPRTIVDCPHSVR